MPLIKSAHYFPHITRWRRTCRCYWRMMTADFTVPASFSELLSQAFDGLEFGETMLPCKFRVHFTSRDEPKRGLQSCLDTFISFITMGWALVARQSHHHCRRRRYACAFDMRERDDAIWGSIFRRQPRKAMRRRHGCSLTCFCRQRVDDIAITYGEKAWFSRRLPPLILYLMSRIGIKMMREPLVSNISQIYVDVTLPPPRAAASRFEARY